MRFPKSELLSLLSTGKPSATSKRLAADASSLDKGLSAVFVRACLATLWQKVAVERLTPREQRARIVELVKWLARKHGWVLVQNHRQNYWLEGQKHEGRLALVLSSENCSVAIETAFSLTKPQLQKLKSAALAGHSPLLLWLGPEKISSEVLRDITVTLESKPIPGLVLAQLTGTTATTRVVALK